MNLKRKGIDAERELVHMFWEKKWVAIRVAASGGMRYPSPDVLAANGLRQLAIECKSTKSSRYYITKKQIEELKFFAEQFGAESWVAIRFLGREWYFLSLEDLGKTQTQYVITKEKAKLMALNFDELTINL